MFLYDKKNPRQKSSGFWKKISEKSSLGAHLMTWICPQYFKADPLTNSHW